MAKKQNDNVNSIQAAEATLADLVAKRDSVAQARANDQSTMDEVAFAAHTGDQKAEARLEAVRERVLRKDLELRSIDSAIQVAKEKVALAQADKAAEAERLAATELLGLCKVLREAGQKADDALAVLGEAAEELGDTITAINRLGVTHPSPLQLQSLGERAVKSALIAHPWSRGFEHLPPKERRNFASFTNEWARALEQAVHHKLKHKAEEAA